jgi:hypothetical protein
MNNFRDEEGAFSFSSSSSSSFVFVPKQRGGVGA